MGHNKRCIQVYLQRGIKQNVFLLSPEQIPINGYPLDALIWDENVATTFRI